MSRACRSLRRLEDPALVAGSGRITADLPADLAVRFVRGAVAAGRILAVTATKGANTVLPRHLPEVKPIRPILHRPDYIAVGQPILADDEVRFVGETIAAERIRDKLLRFAGRLLEAAPAGIVLKSGAAEVAGTDQLLPIETLARAAHHRAHEFQGNIAPGLAESATYDLEGAFSNACQVAIVEVDPETGAVDLQAFIVVEDAGCLINPMVVDGQIRGGVAQGIANALLEEIVCDATGNILTTSLADYLLPAAAEIPAIEMHHLETLAEGSLTKAKGLGEGGAIGAPAAIVNAISDALAPFGVALCEIPAGPQPIRALLRAVMEKRV